MELRITECYITSFIAVINSEPIQLCGGEQEFAPFLKFKAFVQFVCKFPKFTITFCSFNEV